LAQLDAGCATADHDLGTVREEALAELEQRPRLRRRDRARRQQVAGTQSCAVRREMRDELRGGPVERARVAPRTYVAVDLELELDVERPVAPDAKVRERLRLLRPCVDARALEQGEGRHPRGDGGRERLA